MKFSRENLSRVLFAQMGRVFVDYNKDPSTAVMLAGKGRSGTTWMADVINYNNDYRFIFEPFHPEKVEMCRHFGKRKYLRPESEDPLFLQTVDAILRGNIRSAWTDSRNRRFLLADKRLIKAVRANLFLKWLKVNFPQVPIIFAMRHPCAVVSSAMRWGWVPALPLLMQQTELVEDFLEPFVDPINSAQDDFEQHVFGWCIEHYVVLRQFQPGKLHLLFYENLCDNPEEEIDRIFDFLGKEYDERVMKKIRQPSRTTIRQNRELIASGKDLLDGWRKYISREQIRRCVEILEVFGLDQVYTDSSKPDAAGAMEMMKDSG